MNYTTWISYAAYLASPEWAAKRQLVFQRDFYLCRSCPLGLAEIVHHLTYERVYHELLEDLISLCYECHWGIHKHDNRNIVSDLKHFDFERSVHINANMRRRIA